MAFGNGFPPFLELQFLWEGRRLEKPFKSKFEGRFKSKSAAASFDGDLEKCSGINLVDL